jgi:hypothetical protein
MPEIPQYEHQTTFPVTPLPKAPMHNPALEALTKAGATAEAIGQKFGEREIELKRQSEAIALHTDATMKVMDLHDKYMTSPEFHTDPLGTANKFSQEVKQLGEQVAQGIKDRTERAMFQKNFAGTSLHAFGTMSTAASAQQNQLNGSSLFDSINKLEMTAIGAITPEETLTQMGKVASVYNIMETSGYIKPEKRVELQAKSMTKIATRSALPDIDSDPVGAAGRIRNGDGAYAFLDAGERAKLAESADRHAEHKDNVSRINEERAEKERQKTANISAYTELYQNFHLADPERGDYAGAVRFIENPENAKAFGLTEPEQIKNVSGMIETQRHQRLEVKTQNEKAAGESLLELVGTGKITPDQVEGFKDKNGVSPTEEKKASARDKLLKTDAEKKHTDYFLFNQLHDDITSGKTVDLSQYLYDGLSGPSHNTLKTLQTKTQQHDVLNQVSQEFDARYMDPTTEALSPDMANSKKKFLTTINNAIKEGDLKGSQIQDYAKRMYEALDKAIVAKWWFSHSRGPTPEEEVGMLQKKGGLWPMPPVTTPDPAISKRVEELSRKYTPEQVSGFLKERVTTPDPAISKRVEELSGKYTPEQVSGFLKERGFDPGLYGLPK